MSSESRDEASSKSEKVGLLFGYHKEMYVDREEKVSIVRHCCSMYCARGSLTSWSLPLSVGIIVIGALCTLYGYYLPLMYFTLSPEIDANMTLVGNARIRFEKEAKSLNETYHERDAFVISGLVILFLGGILMSMSLLLPLYLNREWRGMEVIPSSSEITVKNELRAASPKIEETALNTCTEETCN